MRVLALIDSPTLSTGFSCVARNLFEHWTTAYGAKIDIWAIGFDGWGYQRSKWQLFPAQEGALIPWYDPRQLTRFLQKLKTGGYTHVFLLQDLFLLAQHDFPKALKQVCQENKIRSLLYFPVDANWMPPQWAEMLASVDQAVAYTKFGKRVAETALDAWLEMNKDKTNITRDWLKPIEVLPHGVDTKMFKPYPGDRMALRRELWKNDKGEPWVQDGDLLMLNVNMHQRRKDLPASLETLAELRSLGVPAKLVLHCKRVSPMGVDLEAVGAQLGLTCGKEWLHHDQFFTGAAHRSSLPEEELCKFYTAADLTLTTTHGEGWGLSITEAVACGCTVVAPHHTSCAEICEIMTKDHPAIGVLKQWPIYTVAACRPSVVLDNDNSLLRPKLHPASCAEDIAGWWKLGCFEERRVLPDIARHELSWPRIAAAMWKLLCGKADK